MLLYDAVSCISGMHKPMTIVMPLFHEGEALRIGFSQPTKPTRPVSKVVGQEDIL